MILYFYLDSDTHYEIPCSLVYGTKWHYIRLNHFKSRTADGGETVVDIGPTIVNCELVMKNVSITDGGNLCAFLEDDLVFTKNTFEIHQRLVTGVDCDPGQGVDLGMRNAISLTGVRLNIENSLEGIFTFVAPGKYDIVLPISYRRSV